MVASRSGAAETQKPSWHVKPSRQCSSDVQEYKPSFVNVTYHREEDEYISQGNGLLKKQKVRKRPGTVGIASAITNRYHVDTVPHIICGGFNKEETENALIDLDYLGVDNLLVLRGDPMKSQGVFVPEPDGHEYASELLEQVVSLNKGIYLDDELKNKAKTDFCIGVAAYPEKHFESPNKKTDLQYLKHKVDKGADYIVTQMFFDIVEQKGKKLKILLNNINITLSKSSSSYLYS